MINRSSWTWMATAALIWGLGMPGPCDAESRDEADSRVVELPQGPLAAYQAKLLDVSLEAVTQMPIMPHLKNRSRAQHKVVKACLTLDQPNRARAYLMRIDNWRRGAASADYALYCAKQGHNEPIEDALLLAKAASLVANQDWQREYIELRTVQTRLILGEKQAGEDFQEQVREDMHRGVIEGTQAKISDKESYEQLVEQLEGLLAEKRYELILNGAQAYATLYRRHYADASRRQSIENKLREAYEKMPGPETTDLLILLADAALANQDHDQARAFADEADQIVKQMRWSATEAYEYQYLSKLAKLRHRAGDSDKARQQLAAAVEKFDRNKKHVVDVWRADALRPLAEAYAEIGDHSRALSIYGRALEQGAVNPNSRPRADDLAETCVSMAVHGVEPDATTWARVHEILESLGPPW